MRVCLTEKGIYLDIIYALTMGRAIYDEFNLWVWIATSESAWLIRSAVPHAVKNTRFNAGAEVLAGSEIERNFTCTSQGLWDFVLSSYALSKWRNRIVKLLNTQKLSRIHLFTLRLYLWLKSSIILFLSFCLISFRFKF